MAHHLKLYHQLKLELVDNIWIEKLKIKLFAPIQIGPEDDDAHYMLATIQGRNYPSTLRPMTT